jgi:hypothetical protein
MSSLPRRPLLIASIAAATAIFAPEPSIAQVQLAPLPAPAQSLTPISPPPAQKRSNSTTSSKPLEPLPAENTKIAMPIATFAGLDKITGRIISFDVAINETVQFGALQVTPRVCYARPSTSAPLTDGFVEVDEITLDNKIRRIFTGWMFADSPGLHAVEHAVYDVWLTDCKQPPAPQTPTAQAAPTQAAPAPTRAKETAPPKPTGNQKPVRTQTP